MHEVMKGIRVIELAQYVFVPAATAVLAEWGAEIIKVEPPRTGDAYRGLRRTGPLAVSGPVNFAIEHANRGKRSVGIDVATPGGREALELLVRSADVFVTNLLPDSRARLRVEVEDLRALNPRLVMVSMPGWGVEGPYRGYATLGSGLDSTLGHAAVRGYGAVFELVVLPSFRGELTKGNRLLAIIGVNQIVI